MKNILNFSNFILLENINSIISLNMIKNINRKVIRKWGGKHGIRDKEQLNSVISRPLQSAFGEDAFKSIWEKSAALLEGIIRFHPFTDGNKRTAWYATKYILNKNNKELNLNYSKASDYILKISENKDITIEDISKWLKKNTNIYK
jgi:death on curing protein